MASPSTIHIAAQGYIENSKTPISPRRAEEIGEVCVKLMGRFSSHTAFNFSGVKSRTTEGTERYAQGAFEHYGIEPIEDEGIIVPISVWGERKLIIMHPYGSEGYKRRIMMHMFGHFVLGKPGQQIPEVELAYLTERMLGPLGMARRFERAVEYGAHLRLHHRREIEAFRDNREQYDESIATRVLETNHNH